MPSDNDHPEDIQMAADHDLWSGDEPPQAENPHVSQVTLKPDTLVPGTRLRAKHPEEQKLIAMQSRTNGIVAVSGIGDSYIIQRTEADDGPRYTCRTFVWQNEFTLTFSELLSIFCEATVPKGRGPQLMSLLTQEELDAH